MFSVFNAFNTFNVSKRLFRDNIRRYGTIDMPKNPPTAPGQTKLFTGTPGSCRGTYVPSYNVPLGYTNRSHQ